MGETCDCRGVQLAEFRRGQGAVEQRDLMITLNTERGLIRVASWDDVLGIPGFVDGVDPKTQSLKSIIGRYIFPDLRACGLASCRTPHGRGFIVDIGGGNVTNIGKDCGERHFGVDFELLSREFTRLDRNASRRERICEFQAQIPQLRVKIDRLRNDDRGDWVFKTARLFRSSECPTPIRNQITRMVQARDNQLLAERMETQAEADARDAMNPSLLDDDGDERTTIRRRLVSEIVGIVEGVSIFYPELDIRALLIIDVLPRLKTIEELSPTELSDRELLDHVKWIGAVDEKLSSAERAIREGRKFLDRDNLAQFRSLLHSSEDVDSFVRLLRLSAASS